MPEIGELPAAAPEGSFFFREFIVPNMEKHYTFFECSIRSISSCLVPTPKHTARVHMDEDLRVSGVLCFSAPGFGLLE